MLSLDSYIPFASTYNEGNALNWTRSKSRNVSGGGGVRVRWIRVVFSSSFFFIENMTRRWYNIQNRKLCFLDMKMMSLRMVAILVSNRLVVSRITTISSWHNLISQTHSLLFSIKNTCLMFIACTNMNKLVNSLIEHIVYIRNFIF